MQVVNKCSIFKIRNTDKQLFFIRYKCYRDKINHLIRKNKKNYYCKYFNKCSQNIRKMWQQINKIVHKNKNKDHVTCIKAEKGIISDPFAIGNKFNEFYSSVASKLVSTIKQNLLITNLWTQNNQIQCSFNPQISQKLKK